jgi:hypothetical protein
MKESLEKVIELGFRRKPKKILDEVELMTAEMARQGWCLKDTLIEESLGNIHLLFEREIGAQPGYDAATASCGERP